MDSGNAKSLLYLGDMVDADALERQPLPCPSSLVMNHVCPTVFVVSGIPLHELEVKTRFSQYGRFNLSKSMSFVDI